MTPTSYRFIDAEHTVVPGSLSSMGSQLHSPRDVRRTRRCGGDGCIAGTASSSFGLFADSITSLGVEPTCARMNSIHKSCEYKLELLAYVCETTHACRAQATAIMVAALLVQSSGYTSETRNA